MPALSIAQSGARGVDERAPAARTNKQRWQRKLTPSSPRQPWLIYQPVQRATTVVGARGKSCWELWHDHALVL